MSGARWVRAQELFHAALERDASERTSFLQEACAGDAQLLAEVARLVAADDDVSRRAHFISPPTPATLGQVLELGSRAAPEAPSDYTGEQFSSVTITRRLASGGMGTVYEAVRRIEDVEQRVAVKVIRDEFASETFTSRFREERRTLARLSHPNIARFFDVGSTPDGKPFLVMELVQGAPITEYCGERGLDAEGRIALFLDVCRAVQYSHANLIIHRDIKPRNVLVDDDGTPKLIDFGIAEAFGADAHPGSGTQATSGALTPEYASPEQVQGGPLTVGSDVYSLGVLLHELLTGTRPCLPGKEDLSGSPGLVSRDLRAIVLKALRREPERRYATVGELVDDLMRMREGHPVHARAGTRSYRAARFVARHKLGVAAATVSVLALLVAGASVIWSLHDRQQRTAEMLRLARMADLSTLEEYEGEANQLWPARPELVPALEEWLRRARELAARQEPYRTAFAGLGDEGEGASEEERWRRAALAELLGRFDDFLAGTVAAVERRLESARTLRARSIEAHAEAWQQAVADIASEPAYAGLRVEPQLGLVPIGRDPQSGFFEFAHLATGSVPRRASDGLLDMGEETGLIFVLLPGGTFTMGARLPGRGESAGWDGADPHAQPNEGPPGNVELGPFFLSKYEMTQGQWTRFAAANPSRVQPGELHGGVRSDLRHPVEMVSWAECTDLLRRLALELPSEAQWEYAARGGTTSVWWTGPEEESLQGAANLADATAERAGAGWRTIAGNSIFDDGHVVHAPVGSFAANPFGLHDVLGNVWEWTADEIVPYSTPASGPRGRRPVSGTRPIVGRGGSFMDLPGSLRCAHRGSSPRDIKDRNIGLRPARPIE